MIPPEIALYIIAAVLSIDIIYRIYGMQSLRKRIMPHLYKHFPLPGDDLNEPDTLIENWQEGYVIGLKTYLESTLRSFEKIHVPKDLYDIPLQQSIDMINKFSVIREMKLSFYLASPDAIHYKPWICIMDNDTERQWERRC